jgi:type IV pilus assembly protein PilY1
MKYFLNTLKRVFQLLGSAAVASKLKLLMLTWLGMALLSTNTWAQLPAQVPLLERTQSVRPNLSLMFDDSLSMRWTCNYARNAQSTLGNTANGVTVGCRNVGTFTSNDFTVLPASDPRYVSPANNGLAYDPRKLYRAPFSAPAVRSANANITVSFAVASNITRFTGTTPNLTPTSYVAPSENFSGTAVEPTGTWQVSYIPAANFDPNTATAATISTLTNYDRIAVGTSTFYFSAAGGNGFFTNRGTVNPLAKPIARTDCTANAAYCTVDEERQNIANWHLYYRDRLSSFRVGVAEAFSELPSTFRFNYSTLGLALTRVRDGARVNRNANDFGGITTMRNYEDSVANFYTWLFQNTGDGFNNNANLGTPLRQALDKLGSYYNGNESSTGPWATSPWLTTSEAAASHLSCRKSFAIMATDGFWNNGNGLAVPSSVNGNDIDGSNGSTIGDNPNNRTYRYVPGSANAWSVGKRDNSASNSGTNSTLADVAMYYWVNDLRTGLTNNVSDGSVAAGPFWQHLNLSTVAFGANGSLTEAQIAQAKLGNVTWPAPVQNTLTALDDLAHAAHNGGGDFLSVSDAQTFADRLRSKLLDIASEESSQAGVAGSTQSLTAGSLKIVAKYVAGKWWGNLTAFNIDPITGNQVSEKWSVVNVNASSVPTGTTTLGTPNSRNIYVYANPTAGAVPFNQTSLSSFSSTFIGTGADQLTTTWSADQTIYIRGDRSKEGDGQPYRQRTAIMGDIVNSTPVFVKNTTPPRYNSWGSAENQTAYTAYKAEKAARDGTVLVGANDGMLHVFRESDGAEVMAYIPRAVFGHLHNLTAKDYGVQHRYYVDGPLNEVDGYIQSTNGAGDKATRWTNVVLGSTGAGAKAVFALDTTEPAMNANDILWEINSSQTAFTSTLGYVTQKVQAGVTASGDWVAVFGNGINSTGGLAKLMVVNLETGALLAALGTNDTTSNGLGGVRLVRNDKGEIIGAYAGDLLGNVWRFDLSTADKANWGNGQLLFTATGVNSTATLPITAAPGVFARSDTLPGYMVVVGTGKLLDTGDISTTYPTQRAFGLWDKVPFGGTATFSAISLSELVTSTASVTSTAASVTTTSFYTVNTTTPIDWAIHRGWRLDYDQLSGQRQIYPVEPLNGLVQLQSVAPRVTSANACTNDGTAKGVNFFIDPMRGACRSGLTLDTNKDNEITALDGASCGLSTIGDGSNATFATGLPENPNSDSGGTGSIPTPSECTNSDYYSVDTTAQGQRIRTCERVVPGVPGIGAKRSVRQVFIRQ